MVDANYIRLFHYSYYAENSSLRCKIKGMLCHANAFDADPNDSSTLLFREHLCEGLLDDADERAQTAE